MCGICDFNWKDEELIRRMNDQLVHHGPDQDGVFCTDQVSLGYRRPSIIDLSEHGLSQTLAALLRRRGKK